MEEQKQNSNLQRSPSQGLVLSENEAAQNNLDEMILACLAVQKLYGRDAANAGEVTRIFQIVLAPYSAEKVLRAFRQWIEESQEFPTPADIAGLIRRNGRPPLSEARYVTISKKDGEYRTPEEWRYMREFEAESRGEAWGADDSDKQAHLRVEIAELRKQVIELKKENSRLAGLIHKRRTASPFEAPKLSMEDKLNNTIEHMRNQGASDDEVEQMRGFYAN